MNGTTPLVDFALMPEKYLFIDISGFDGVLKNAADSDTLLIKIGVPKQVNLTSLPLSKNSFRLGCTPAVNVSEFVYALPGTVARNTEYTIDPTGNTVNGMPQSEVLAVESVMAGNKVMRRLFGGDHRSSVDVSADWSFETIQRPITGLGNGVCKSTIRFFDGPPDATLDTVTIRGLKCHGDLCRRYDIKWRCGNREVHQLIVPTVTLRPLSSTVKTDPLRVSGIMKELPMGRASDDCQQLLARIKAILALNCWAGDAEASDLPSEAPWLQTIREALVSLTQKSDHEVIRKPLPHCTTGDAYQLKVKIGGFPGKCAVLFGNVLSEFLLDRISGNSFHRLTIGPSERPRNTADKSLVWKARFANDRSPRVE